MDRRVFPTLLQKIRSLAQMIFKLEQKWYRSIEIRKINFIGLEEGRGEVGESSGNKICAVLKCSGWTWVLNSVWIPETRV
jgi:hypothetical protein